MEEQAAPDTADEKKTEETPLPVTEKTHKDAPLAWLCKIADASVGRFVVLEVMYDKPKHRRGITVAQIVMVTHDPFVFFGNLSS